MSVAMTVSFGVLGGSVVCSLILISGSLSRIARALERFELRADAAGRILDSRMPKGPGQGVFRD